MYYKQIIFMDGERMRISPQEALPLEQAILSGTKHMRLRGITVALSTIARIETTSEIVEDVSLPSGEADSGIEETAEGVRTRYVKKLVPQKEWEKYYHGHPGYYKLDTDSSGVWVGFSKVGDPKHFGGHLLLCTPTEIQIIEKAGSYAG